MRVVVTQIGWEGRMRRRALDTSGLADAGHWETLIEQVLAAPPPYRADPGQPVYVIHAGHRAVLVGQQDLTSPLAGLVERILETGEAPLAANQPADAAAAATSPPMLRRLTRGPRPQGPGLSRAAHPAQERASSQPTSRAEEAPQ